MKILIAPDKFKDSLSALEVCEALKKGLSSNTKQLDIIFHPMADGGDGSLEIISNYLPLQKQLVQTTDPLARTIDTFYYTSSNTAFIELASASGIVLLNQTERNPMLTSTLGTGKILLDALSKGYQEIYLFLGGSATNDAGLGICEALGFYFLDAQQNELPPIGENLIKIKSIQNHCPFDFEQTKITLICDVNNPLYGTNGAAYTYAPQKGATPQQVEYLDKGLQNVAQVLKQHTGIEVGTLAGSGAAGGIGAGLVALCKAKMLKGFDTIAQLTNLEQQIQAADWVISGEGKLDKQSLRGKVISGIAQLCQKHQKPLALFVGKNELSAQDLKALNTQHIYAIDSIAQNTEDAMTNGAAYLEELGQQFYTNCEL